MGVFGVGHWVGFGFGHWAVFGFGLGAVFGVGLGAVFGLWVRLNYEWRVGLGRGRRSWRRARLLGA